MTNVIHAGPTVSGQVLRALARYPEHTAFAEGGARRSYRAVLDLIGAMQAVFTASRMTRGGRVAVLSANRSDAWCASVAAQACALSITWLHPLASLDDQVDQLVDGECTAVVIDGSHYLVRGADIAARISGIAVFTLGPSDYGRDLLALAAAAGSVSARDLARPDDISVLNYTGGTTGKSKGALRTHAQSAAGSPAILADFDLPLGLDYLVVAPMSHVAGTKILPTLMQGGTVHLQKGFDPQAVLDVIARERINVMVLVPTMIYVLLDHPGLEKADLSSLETLLYGASPMSPTRLSEGLERLGPVFAQLYGQTECYPISLLRKSDHDLEKPDLFASCGAAISTVDVKILDDQDQEVALGEPGEICVRSAHALTEYWKRPEETKALFSGGWLHTGDIARMDERGYMFIMDRKKDMIVSGGFNIYPRDVEDVLSTHPAVAMASVIGTPDPKWGEAVMAMIVLRAGKSVEAQELMDLVKARKGSTHAPKRVEFVEQLPLTAVGKVDKKVLRAKYWAATGRMVG